MDALELVRLTPLMKLSSGRSEIAIALIDGPVVRSAVQNGSAEYWLSGLF